HVLGCRAEVDDLLLGAVVGVEHDTGVGDADQAIRRAGRGAPLVGVTFEEEVGGQTSDQDQHDEAQRDQAGAWATGWWSRGGHVLCRGSGLRVSGARHGSNLSSGATWGPQDDGHASTDDVPAKRSIVNVSASAP